MPAGIESECEADRMLMLCNREPTLSNQVAALCQLMEPCSIRKTNRMSSSTRNLIASRDWHTSVRDLARSQRKAISAVRDFFGTDESYIVVALVLAGRCIDLRMGVPHGNGPFSPLLFVLGVSHLAHKLQQGEWYDNELGAAFFDVDVELLDIYERGICEILHRHSSLLVGREQRDACRVLLQEIGILSREQPQPITATKAMQKSSGGDQSASQLVGAMAMNGHLLGAKLSDEGDNNDAGSGVNEKDDEDDEDDEDFDEDEETGFLMASEVDLEASDLEHLLSSWLPTPAQTVEQAA